MNGKRKFLGGIILGAIVGGITSLCNKEARGYAKARLNKVKNDTTYYMKNPAQGLSKLRETLDNWNDNLVSNTQNTINALEQVEETIKKVAKK